METRAFRVAQASSRLRRVTHEYLGSGEQQRCRVVDREVSELGLARHLAKGGHGSPSLLAVNKMFLECLPSAPLNKEGMMLVLPPPCISQDVHSSLSINPFLRSVQEQEPQLRD